MNIYLIRHGNTFNKEDTPVYLGLNEDLELTDFGLSQAQNAYQFFKSNNIIIDKTYASELKRTKAFADIVNKDTNLEVNISTALNEVDYGSWGNKSSQEIIDTFGVQAYNSWNIDSNWQAEFKTDFNQLIDNIKNFIKYLKKNYINKNIVLISSNGVIRYFLYVLNSSLYNKYKLENNLKVGTGNLVHFKISNKNVQLLEWNKKL